MKYVKRPYVFIEKENPQSLFVDHMGNWFLLRGAIVEIIVEDLLSYLTEPHSWEEIKERYEGRVEEKDLEDVLSRLMKLGVIEEEEEEERDIPREIGGFFGLFTPYLEEKRKRSYFRRLETSSVLIIGEGKVTEGIGEILRTSGVGKVIWKEWQPTEKNSLLAGRDLVIYVGSERASGIALEVNQTALERETPVLYVEVDWAGGIVGPLVVPQETACFQCYLERKESNRDDDVGYKLMKQRGIPWRSTTEFAPIVNWLISMGVMETVKFLSRYLYPETLKGVFLVDAINYRVQFHPVLKLPFCSACGYVDKMPPQQVWTEEKQWDTR